MSEPCCPVGPAEEKIPDAIETIEQIRHVNGWDYITVLLLRPISEMAVVKLLASSAIKYILLDDVTLTGTNCLGSRVLRLQVSERTFHLPRISPAIVLDSPVRSLPVPLLWALYRNGGRIIVEQVGLLRRKVTLSRELLYRFARAAVLRCLALVERFEGQVQSRQREGGRPIATGIIRCARAAIHLGRGSLAVRDITASDLVGAPLLGAHEFERSRILMINSALAWGGAERQLVNTMVGLAARGWDVQLACENLGRVPDSDFFAPELERHGLTFRLLDSFNLEPGRQLSVGLARRLEEWLERLPPPFTDRLWPYLGAMLTLRPSIVHAWQDQTNVLAGVAARIVGVPRIVLSTRNIAPTNFSYHQPHMRAGYRALITQPSVRLLNNSHAGAADYASWLDLPSSTLSVVHNGIELCGAGHSNVSASSIFSNGVPLGTPIVGSVFRLYVEKDPRLWVETAAIIAGRRPDVHFVIVGTGPLARDASNLARRRGFSDRLHFTGTLRDPSSVLRAMSVFLLTSKFEGLPNVLIEAQLHGIPVVSTRAGGSAETFLDGETGWLVEKREPSVLAEHILQVLDDVAWRERCRVQAPRFARERFGIERMLDETLKVYDLNR